MKEEEDGPSAGRHPRGAAKPPDLIHPSSFILLPLALGALALPFVLDLAMSRGLNHDEHQHIAAGMLWAREGLLPYRDYPHFHTPYLAFVYGELFRWTAHPLLVARAFSVACAAGIVALVGWVAFAECRRHVGGSSQSRTPAALRPRHQAARGSRKSRLRAALPAALGAVALCLFSAVFTHTTGRAWNQEPALLLVLLAFVAHLRGLRDRAFAWLVAGGVLLGLAIGFRITHAPLIAPFGLATLLWAGERRIAAATAFSAGLLAGLAGVFAMCLAAPEGFLFGNFEFAKVNITYRFATGEPRTMTLVKKLRFLWKEVLRPEAGLVAAALVPWVAAAWHARRTGERLRIELRFLLLLLPFVLMGALAPSPVFEQYFYPLAPFLVLAGIFALAALPAGSRAARSAWIAATAGLVLSVGLHARVYKDLPELLSVRKWAPMKIHDRAQVLREHLSGGQILTLAPIHPLEAGLSIDPSFATGPFAWRIAPFVEPAKAARLRIVTAGTLSARLDAAPPAGILLGFEKRGEETLADYARHRGYTRVPLEDGGELWTRPSR